MEQVNPQWRKASYSGNGANCVEAGTIPGAILIRDTKNRGHGPVLCIRSTAFAEFTARVRKGAVL